MTTPARDERGRLLPGNTGNPNGRPKRETEQSILDAIRRALPPEVIEAKIKRALEIAEETNSARGMIAVLEFAAAYSLGRPTVRVEQTANAHAELSELMQAGVAEAMKHWQEAAQEEEAEL